jgi:hypothetical protein
VPYFICPNCKNRSIDDDGRQGLLRQAVSCERCGFGFLFEILDDYYPPPTAGLVACDRDGRILAAGRGVFELTGYGERELMGKDVVRAPRAPLPLRPDQAGHRRRLPGLRRGRRRPRRALVPLAAAASEAGESPLGGCGSHSER